jgi:2-oxoglutarate/2-oxoacid ferredoxin oxidoreductase subunit beta
MTAPRMPKVLKMASKPSNFCPGCGYGIILRVLGEVIDEMEIAPRTIIGLDIGCNLLAWNYFDLDTAQSHHGRVTPMLAGYKRGQKESVAIGIAGDGGLYAIGLQGLIHTAHRNEPVMIIGVNNTVYAMTGGQASPTTYHGEVTTTTPGGEFTADKPILGPEMLQSFASEGAFLARATVNNIPVLKSYLKKAIAAQLAGNFSLVEIVSYCPTNWKTDAAATIEFSKKLETIYKPGVIRG